MCFSTKVKTDTPQPQPAASSTQGLGEATREAFQAQLDYNPQIAAQDFSMAEMYAPKYEELLRGIEQDAYPYTAKLQEQLAQRASEGIGGSLTPQLEQSYRDRLRSEIGPNVGSGIGADYVSRGIVDAEQQYQSYYDNLGLSLTGRLPLSQAQNPQLRTADMLVSPSGQMGYNQGVYGIQGSIFSNLYNSQASLQASKNQAMGQMIGTGTSAGMMLMCWVASEIYGGWFKPKTVAARYYVANEAPSWFRNAYIKHGKQFAEFIKDKPVIKAIIKPLFDFFAKKGGYNG